MCLEILGGAREGEVAIYSMYGVLTRRFTGEITQNDFLKFIYK